jgi:hypothetical protein
MYATAILSLNKEKNFWNINKGGIVWEVGDIYEVSNVDSEKLAKPVKVSNFEVEDWHTYFVSEEMIPVHNMCSTNTTSNSTNRKLKTKKIQRYLTMQHQVNVLED